MGLLDTRVDSPHAFKRLISRDMRASGAAENQKLIEVEYASQPLKHYSSVSVSFNRPLFTVIPESVAEIYVRNT